MRDQIGVRRAESEDHSLLARTLAAAFADDPAWSHLLPFADRPRRQRLFFETELRHLVPERREVWTAAGGGAVAVWARPGGWSVPVGNLIVEAPAMARVFGRRLMLALRHLIRAERKHPRHPEHWYLHYLGAEPAQQGKGLGSALMRPVLETCDREGVAAYLEASSERNCGLYERHGFRVVETFPMPGGGPPIRRMWRDPRPAPGT